MNIAPLIFGGLLLLQIVTMNLLFTDYAHDYFNQFEEERLQIAVNYAVDGATKEMKEDSSHLGQDYESMAKLNVDPIVAMDTFSAIMCKNYNIPVSSTTQQSVMCDYVPVFVVATYDGYYKADRVKINSSGVENMIFSTKLPYLKEVIDEDGNYTYYSYNLSLDDCLRVDSNGSVVKDYDPPLTRAEQSDLINNTISDILNDQLLKYANQDPRGEVYIPSEFTTIRSTNPVRNTTVFAYIDGFDLPAFGMNLQSFGIGGADIRQKQVVVGFTVEVNGKIEKYYAYSENIPDGVTIIETYDSQKDAAEDGYYYWIG